VLPEHEIPQDMPSHVAIPEPAVGPGHVEQDDPHDAVDALLMQVPPQSCSPEGHWQAPPEHVLPPAHALPQLPQLLGSLDKSAQAPPQG
jgi:hypothetical protein